MDCEICGNKAFNKININGSIFFACNDCQKFGVQENKSFKIHSSMNSGKKPASSIFLENEPIFVQDFGKKIIQARQQKGLSSNELALQLHEKESFLKKIEQGKAFPDKTLLKKIENFLGIKITEQ